MNLTLVTPPQLTDEPLSTEEVRDFLRLQQIDDEDTMSINRLIPAVREIAEVHSGRHQARKQFTLALDNFPSSRSIFTWPYSTQYTDPILYQFQIGPSFIELLDPLVSVDDFTFAKSDGTVVTLFENTDFVVDTLKHPGVVSTPYGKTWPGDAGAPSSAVQITFTCGYLPAEVSASTKQWMVHRIAQMFTKRLPIDDVRAIIETPYMAELINAKKLWKF